MFFSYALKMNLRWYWSKFKIAAPECRKLSLMYVDPFTILGHYSRLQQKTARDFEQPQYDNHSPVPPTDTTPRLDETDDITSISQYVRNLNGQIQVTSELGKGTTFSVELDFKHPVKRPRKIRNLFLPSLRSSPQGPPPSGPPPRSPRSPRAINNDHPGRAEGKGNTQHPMTPRSSSLPPVHRTLTPRPSDPALRLSPIKDETSSHYRMNEAQNSLATLNVLIADADPLDLRMSDERLSQWGHVVDITSDGQECHDRFAANPSKFDVILMDLKVWFLIK
jgi:CheY-like chemotaxis protein